MFQYHKHVCIVFWRFQLRNVNAAVDHPYQGWRKDKFVAKSESEKSAFPVVDLQLSEKCRFQGYEPTLVLHAGPKYQILRSREFATQYHGQKDSCSRRHTHVDMNLARRPSVSNFPRQRVFDPIIWNRKRKVKKNC